MFQWKKTAALVLILATALAGSASAAGNGKFIASAPVIKQQISTQFSLKTEGKEKAVRYVEGSKAAVDVTRYTMLPFKIAFKMDSDWKPAVDASKNSVSFSRSITAKQKISFSLQMFKGRKLTDVGVALQKEFVGKGYKRTAKVELKKKGQLQGTIVKYSGKSQDAGYTLYNLKSGVLVVKHAYPLDAGDGMEPLLAQLRAGIAVK